MHPGPLIFTMCNLAPRSDWVIPFIQHMLISPTTRVLKSRLRYLVSDLPKLLYLGPRFSLGHFTLLPPSDSEWLSLLLSLCLRLWRRLFLFDLVFLLTCFPDVFRWWILGLSWARVWRVLNQSQCCQCVVRLHWQHSVRPQVCDRWRVVVHTARCWVTCHGRGPGVRVSRRSADALSPFQGWDICRLTLIFLL